MFSLTPLYYLTDFKLREFIPGVRLYRIRSRELGEEYLIGKRDPLK
jgi:hypothetical protein